MSQVISMRVTDAMAERLDRFARRLGNGMTRTKAGVILLEESLRENEFALIEFRDSPVGRQAYLKDSSLAVWEVVLVARSLALDVSRTAEHLERPTDWVQAALNYYAAYPEEIDQAIEDNRMGYEAMKRLLPGLRLAEAQQHVPGVATEA